jgi:hypothetical protein
MNQAAARSSVRLEVSFHHQTRCQTLESLPSFVGNFSCLRRPSKLDSPCCDSPRTDSLSFTKAVMTNVNCIRCGVVNFAGDDACRVCGVELTPATSFGYADPKPNADSSAQDRHSIPTLTTIREFWGVGDVLGPTLSLFFRNFWLITKIVFVIVAPFEVFKVLSISGRPITDWPFRLEMFALGLLCNVLIAPALIYALMKLLQTGTAPSVTESYRLGLSKLGRLTLYAIVVGIIEALGFVVLVIPGIMLMCALYLVYPITVFEDLGLEDTLRRSFNLTNGFRWKIFGATFVMAILLGVLTLAISAVPVFFAFNGMPFWPFSVIAAIVVDILDQGTTVLSLVTYLSLLRTLESGRTQ